MSGRPLIVCVRIPELADPGEIAVEVYCVNETEDTFSVRVGSTPVTTVDEDHGALVEHGSTPASMMLGPGAVELVATIERRELDGLAGLAAEYLRHGSWERERVTYGFEGPGTPYTLERLGKTGHAIPPIALFPSPSGDDPHPPPEPACDDSPSSR